MARFKEDLDADSLDEVDMVIGTEDEFEIQIPDEDAEKIKTVDQAVAYLMRRVSELCAEKPKPRREPSSYSEPY